MLPRSRTENKVFSSSLSTEAIRDNQRVAHFRISTRAVGAPGLENQVSSPNCGYPQIPADTHPRKSKSFEIRDCRGAVRCHAASVGRRTSARNKTGRKKSSSIWRHFHHPRYEPYETTTGKGFNPATIGNALIGGIVGVLVDLASGGIHAVNPSEIKPTLEAKPDTVTLGIGATDRIPEEAPLEKIGRMVPKEAAADPCGIDSK